ncbi:MAG: hypothetical protein GY941_16450 [Planctomycetes bacterium]|nr:hypothetical protein [Planctomycetota bacterium]
MKYYSDRDYALETVPVQYAGLNMIKVPNDDRGLTLASDYLTFKADSHICFLSSEPLALIFGTGFASTPT